MPYFVSRQQYWPDGAPVVEIAGGGLDYANPDMLVTQWRTLGEGQEFDDPRDAVTAAMQICEQWRKTKPDAQIAYGYTGGHTAPFEPCTYVDAEKWAEKVWEALPKCAGCESPLGARKYKADDWSGMDYCSGECAQREIDFQEEEQARMEQEGEEA